jgi:hypothetical protein
MKYFDWYLIGQVLLIVTTGIIIRRAYTKFAAPPRRRPIKDWNDKLNAALEIVQEFGSRRAISPEDRIKVLYPEFTEDEISSLVGRCRLIEKSAYDLAMQYLSGKLREQEANAKLSEIYPELSPELSAQTLSQAVYFASK